MHIKKTLGAFLANGPRLKIRLLDLRHFALAVESKTQCLRLALDHLDRQLNDLINVFRSDLCGSIGTGGVENRRLGQLAMGLDDDGPRAIFTNGTADAGLVRLFLCRNAGLVSFFLCVTGNTHHAHQAGESK